MVLAGSIGGARRFTYTVIGDMVNVAARLEGLNKNGGTTILLTEETRVARGDTAETRPCREMLVKGRGAPSGSPSD